MRMSTMQTRVTGMRSVLDKPKVSATLLILLTWILVHTAILATTESFVTTLWCSYAVALAFFHLSEFTWSAFYEQATASFDSFLLNQNWPDYQRAIGAAVVEFLLEAYVVNTPFKSGGSITYIMFWSGVVLVCVGQIIRMIGMWTAGVSFTHRVAEVHRREHTLVTTGIFRFLRHPAYFGWFYFAIGTQLLLCNPLCAVLYGYVAWRFFLDRIPAEESKLKEFFGQDYVAYARRTPIGIPGIHGLAAIEEPAFASGPGRSLSYKESQLLGAR